VGIPRSLMLVILATAIAALAATGGPVAASPHWAIQKTPNPAGADQNLSVGRVMPIRKSLHCGWIFDSREFGRDARGEVERDEVGPPEDP